MKDSYKQSSCQGECVMSLIFKPFDETSAYTIVSWRYEPPYDIYNLLNPPGEEDIQYLLDPQNAFHRIVDESENLLAFCSFGQDGQVPGGDYSTHALDIGLGLRPDLTGQGRGLIFVNAVLDFARHTFAPTRFRVTVAEFNQRAWRVWEKAGFRRVQIFQKDGGGQNYIVLLREA
jgi:ribosomal-protein-alanine N-acetyltransferase